VLGSIWSNVGANSFKNVSISAAGFSAVLITLRYSVSLRRETGTNGQTGPLRPMSGCFLPRKFLMKSFIIPNSFLSKAVYHSCRIYFSSGRGAWPATGTVAVCVWDPRISLISLGVKKLTLWLPNFKLER